MSGERKAATVIILAGLALITGCGTSEADSVDNAPFNRGAWSQPLPDGRSVICVYASGGSGGGVTCDWERAS